MELLHILAYFIIAVFSSLFLFLYKRNQYWQDRNVLQDRPVLFFGNMRGVGTRQGFRDPFYNFYMKYKVQAPFGGFYLSLRPCLVVFDLDLIKGILIKDFHNFADRGNYHNERDDPLTANLLNLDGPKWRRLRAKLTPTFTSGKMKFMFGTVVDVAERFVSVLADHVQEKRIISEAVEIEIKDLLARFTTDVIASCAFGVECNSLADPQVAFRVMGHRAFMERRQGHIAFAFTNAFPNLARKLHMKVLRDDVSTFFMRVVRDMVEYRDRENVQRNDFMNLLMQLRNNNETDGLSIEEMAAQAFVFFMAGFESSSSTVTFALYELALNQDIQNKAREEIIAMFERYENKFTYEGMNELKYTQQIFQETLRKYSIAPAIARKAINDYPIPNSKHVIEKGTLIIVPIDALQRDPAIYPEPDVFNPDRFLPTEVEKRHSMAWLPFGEGPRNCIASRFGEMQSIIGLALLLKNFRFTVSEKTPIPIVFDKKTISLTPEGGNLHLNIEKV